MYNILEKTLRENQAQILIINNQVRIFFEDTKCIQILKITYIQFLIVTNLSDMFRMPRESCTKLSRKQLTKLGSRG